MVFVKAGHHGQNEEENASPLQNLEKMGFPKDLVHRASEECSKCHSSNNFFSSAMKFSIKTRNGDEVLCLLLQIALTLMFF